MWNYKEKKCFKQEQRDKELRATPKLDEGNYRVKW